MGEDFIDEKEKYSRLERSPEEKEQMRKMADFIRKKDREKSR